MPVYNQPENFDAVATLKDLQKRIRTLETVPNAGTILQKSAATGGSGALSGTDTYLIGFPVLTGLYLYPKRAYAFVGALVLSCTTATDAIKFTIWQQNGGSPNPGGGDALLSTVTLCPGTTTTVGPIPFFNLGAAALNVQNGTLYGAASRTGAGTDIIISINGASPSWWGVMDVGVA